MNHHKHNLGDAFVFVSPLEYTSHALRVVRVKDGYLYNKVTKTFVASTDPNHQDVLITLLPHSNPNYSHAVVDFINDDDCLFEVVETSTHQIKEVERHVWGGYFDPTLAHTCLIYGRLRGLDGKALKRSIVQVVFDPRGFFNKKQSALIENLTATTDDTGYFELRLLQGAEVTLVAPALNQSVSGKVPNKTSIEIQFAQGKLQ